MDTAPTYPQAAAAPQPVQHAATPPAGGTTPPSSPHHFLSTKTLLVGAIAAMIILVAIGAGIWAFQNLLKRQQADAPITLTYWGLWEPNEVLQGVLDRYHTLHPNVTVNYEMRPVENHYATVRSRISSNKSSAGEMPDIVRMHASWVPVLKNYLSPVPTSIMSDTDYEAAFYPATKDQLLLDKQYYGLPYEVDGLALVYNQEMFTAAGITQTPTTWDEIRQAAAKLTQRDEKNNVLVGGIAMGSAKNVDHYADIIGLLMAQNGVVFTDSKGNVTFHQSLSGDGRNLGAETLSFFTLFTSEKYWSESMETSTLAFSKSKVGMILVPSWRVLSLVSQNPQMQIKVAAVPHLTTDQKTGYASYWVETVPKASAHQAAAWEFLKFLTDQEQQTSMYSLQQQIRPFGEPFGHRNLASSLESDPLVGPYVVQAPDYKASLFANDTGATELNDAINQALAEAIVTVQAAGSSRDEKAQEAIAELAEQVSEIIESQR